MKHGSKLFGGGCMNENAIHGAPKKRRGRIARRCGEVWHEPLAGHGQPLALSTLPLGVAPSPCCGFGVTV